VTDLTTLEPTDAEAAREPAEIEARAAARVRSSSFAPRPPGFTPDADALPSNSPFR